MLNALVVLAKVGGNPRSLKKTLARLLVHRHSRDH